VTKFLNEKLADGCSPSLTKYLRVVLRVALSYAVSENLAERNAAKDARPPKHLAIAGDPEAIKPYSEDEVKKLLAALKGHRLEALFTAVLAVGLRHSEALGLVWPDFDEESGTLRVFYQLQRLDGTLQRVTTKSDDSRRIVHLPAICVTALKDHRARQVKERAFAGDRWKETGFIFTSTIGTPLGERNVLRDFDAIVKKAGLPKRRIHDLRHTAISLLAANGVPLKTISGIVGHSDVRLTENIYRHVFSEEKREAAAKMDAILKG